MTAPDLLEELERLSAAATPGEWTVEGEAVEWSIDQQSPHDDAGAGISVGGDWSNTVVLGGCQDEQGGAVGILRNADAEFIVAAVNCVRAALAAPSTPGDGQGEAPAVPSLIQVVGGAVERARKVKRAPNLDAPVAADDTPPSPGTGTGEAP